MDNHYIAIKADSVEKLVVEVNKHIAVGWRPLGAVETTYRDHGPDMFYQAMISKSIIKYIQSLQHKKFRDEHNAFVAEGPKVVDELLSGRLFNCKHIYATAAWIEDNKQKHGELASIIILVKDFELEKLSGLKTANQVVAEFEKRKSAIPNDLKNKITLLLDDIHDPGNLGTIIRIADWFAVESIVCSENTVDMYNPKVVQSTMASHGRVNIFYTDLQKFIQSNSDVSLYCAVLDGDKLEKIFLEEGLVLIGNESKGIHADLLALPHKKISIAKFGEAESLNAAVAAGIILFAIK